MATRTPKLVSEETRAAIAELLSLVTTEANERLGNCLPNFRLCADSSFALIRKHNGKTQFFVTDTGDVLPEGRTDRSTNWIGFWGFAEQFLEQLSPEKQRLIEAALADCDWPNMRW